VIGGVSGGRSLLTLSAPAPEEPCRDGENYDDRNSNAYSNLPSRVGAAIRAWRFGRGSIGMHPRSRGLLDGYWSNRRVTVAASSKNLPTDCVDELLSVVLVTMDTCVVVRMAPELSV
jgi:hypothetical protein